VDVFVMGTSSLGSYGSGVLFTLAPNASTGIAMVQLVFGAEIATVTVSYGYDISAVDTCDFNVQVVDSNG
jgi:hypothetical protein